MYTPQISTIPFIFRVFTYLFPKKFREQKNLQISIVERGVVVEMRQDFPLHIADETGRRFDGVYVIGMRIWNKGTLPVLKTDVLETNPIFINVGKDAEIIFTSTIAPPDGPSCKIEQINTQTICVHFDAFNPNDYVEVGLFITGNFLVQVNVTGKIIGQETSIDHTGFEGKAPLGERFINGSLFLLIVTSIPILCLASAEAIHIVGLKTLFTNPRAIPEWLSALIAIAGTIPTLLVTAFFARKFERRKHPEGVPLLSDLEPSLYENLRGMLLTAAKGQKHRVSLSMFDFGKPIIITSRKFRKRTIDDWIVK